MPSPFPGMDPYLEGSLWMTVHTQLSAEIARQLAPKLRPKYLALTTERFVYEAPEDIAIARSNLHPDVGVSRTGLKRPSSAEATVAEPPLRMATTIPTAIQHVTIEIRDAANRQLVTAIEVRSPTNKRGDGYDEYLAKRRKILLSTSHLVEVDLLRSGKRVPMQQQLPAASYFVFVSRAEHRPLLDVWPIGLTGRLPTIPIPLLPGDADVFLDLQHALSNVYDLLGYDLAIDYEHSPEIPLESEEATWAEAQLRSRQMR